MGMREREFHYANIFCADALPTVEGVGTSSNGCVAVVHFGERLSGGGNDAAHRPGKGRLISSGASSFSKAEVSNRSRVC